MTNADPIRLDLTRCDPTFPVKRTDAILHLLEQADGWCSGEAISESLGISRAAVSKHITTLRVSGHAIESLTRRGYRLLAKYVPLDMSFLQSHLETKVLGQQGWSVFKTIPSSNQEAARQAMDGAPTGKIVVAEDQSQGRGSKGHDWFSSPRGLHFSIILRPEGQGFDTHALTQAAMLAVAESIKTLTGLQATLKQPNDIILGTRKIAGILVETGFRGLELDWAILGIGYNINALESDFPIDLADRCTSLLVETGRSFDRSQCLVILLNALEETLKNLGISY